MAFRSPSAPSVTLFGRGCSYEQQQPFPRCQSPAIAGLESWAGCREFAADRGQTAKTLPVVPKKPSGHSGGRVCHRCARVFAPGIRHDRIRANGHGSADHHECFARGGSHRRLGRRDDLQRAVRGEQLPGQRIDFGCDGNGQSESTVQRPVWRPCDGYRLGSFQSSELAAIANVPWRDDLIVVHSDAP